VRTLISQTRKAVEAELYYVALMSALAIPDIAGALSAENGRATGDRYATWYEEWARPRLLENRGRENPLSGQACYGFRCALLHQGRSQRQSDQYSNILFIEPGHQNYSIHYCVVGGGALLIQLAEFIEEVLRGCELWLQSVEGTEPFEKNYQSFARRHPQGLAPYVVGVPVVG
jgi:hypothetical protein